MQRQNSFVKDCLLRAITSSLLLPLCIRVLYSPKWIGYESVCVCMYVRLYIGEGNNHETEQRKKSTEKRTSNKNMLVRVFLFEYSFVQNSVIL